MLGNAEVGDFRDEIGEWGDVYPLISASYTVADGKMPVGRTFLSVRTDRNVRPTGTSQPASLYQGAYAPLAKVITRPLTR